MADRHAKASIAEQNSLSFRSCSLRSLPMPRHDLKRALSRHKCSQSSPDDWLSALQSRKRTREGIDFIAIFFEGGATFGECYVTGAVRYCKPADKSLDLEQE